jgi:hypothetical protein
MPASGHLALIVSTAAAVGTVVVALAVVMITRFIVRLAAEPDRADHHAPVSDRRLERGR